MKTQFLLIAVAAVAACGFVYAEPVPTAEVIEVAASLTPDELAFAAKLSDKNRKAFTDKFSEDQRKATMTAFSNGADADEAVRNMLFSKERKEESAVAQAEEEA